MTTLYYLNLLSANRLPDAMIAANVLNLLSANRLPDAMIAVNVLGREVDVDPAGLLY